MSVKKTGWAALAGVILLLAVLAATPSQQNTSHQTTAWNGPIASPDTLVLTPPVAGLRTAVDYIHVSNIAGGTATFANVALIRRNRDLGGDLVMWQAKAVGPASPSFWATLAPPGGLYKSGAGDTIKIAVTLASASSLYVACGFHQEN